VNGPRRAALAMTGGAAVTALALALAACGGDDAAPELTAGNAFVPEPVTGDMAAGFFTIENTGDADDTLTSVTSDAAGAVEMHETAGNAMRPVDSFPIPAGGQLRLSRGGNHLMLLDLPHKPTEGDTLSLELHFEESDPIILRVPVESATHTGDEAEE
jgi:periplasmic copper chaperone A